MAGRSDYAFSAYETLKWEIVTGQRRPGSVFEEKVFAEQIGVSRTPVREAVIRLARERLLEVVPRRGTFVSEISMEDIRQIYEMRRILEPQIVEIAAEKADRKRMETWRAYFERVKAGEEMLIASAPLPDSDAAFHLFLAESTGNRFIREQMETLMTQTQRIRCLSNRWKETRQQASVEEHLEMIRDMLEGDTDAAKEAAVRHLNNSEEGYRMMAASGYLSDLRVFR
ncbi:MAG: GntR family transcriptional regulator [Lachnospiraceae bacterium]|nr:GntR family transcriptional regulator [Lachnospiraceae bacterium]